MRSIPSAPFFLAALFAAYPAAANAQTTGPEAPSGKAVTGPDNAATLKADIVVYGRGERRIGIAAAASEGGVAGADIENRPLLRPAELLEATPGLIATQHSGGGKANQYFLRGFNLDHGTDYSTYIDDMPMNFRTHGHGQGYLDVNGLIPESVKRVDYRKGPYRVDAGDFSFVGSSAITTKDTLKPFAAIEVGGYGYRRAVGGGSVQLGEGDLLAIGQAKANDGPWSLPEDFLSFSGLVKYSAPLLDGQFKVAAHFYTAKWSPTEQIPERAIGVQLKDRYDTLDRSLRGRTERAVVTLNYVDDNWRLTAWGQHYDWSLASNFLFFLDDPVNGDQLRQFEKRWSWGARIERTAHLTDALSLRLGSELREDAVAPVGLDHTIDGRFDYLKSAFKVRESSAGLYGEAVWHPLARLMIIGGLRADWYRFRTQAVGGDAWDGTVKDHIVTSKIGANYELGRGIAAYANFGEGFHSNDARGVTSPTHPAPGLVKGKFKELGVRFERGSAIVTADYWWSSIDSELIYVGDSGAVEPSDPAKRRGYEVTLFWKPFRWLALDGVWTGSHARYVGAASGQDHVPGALESSGELGISAVAPTWNISARLRFLGPHPLIEDNSQRGRSTTLLNLRAAWSPPRFAGFEFHVELLNALDSKEDDVEYFYTTRLPGEAPDGVEGRLSRIVEPRQIRVGVKKTF